MAVLLAVMAAVMLLGMGAAWAREVPKGTLDAKCDWFDFDGTAVGYGQAQTFTAIRNGKLTAVTAWAGKGESDTGDTVLQISTTNALGRPTDNILATRIVPDGTETFPLTANFDPKDAASVVAGRKYALIIRSTTDASIDWTLNTGNQCPEGQLYRYWPPTGKWYESGNIGESWDGVFATYVSAPDTVINSAPPALTNSNDARLRFSSTWTPPSGESASFSCSLDGHSFGQCNSPLWLFDLPDGKHIFKVQSCACPSNLDLSPAEVSWFVDTTIPRGSVIINNDRMYTASRTVTLELSAHDRRPASGVAKMRFRNSGGEWSAWKPYVVSKDWSLSSGAGTKTVYVQYKDRAGNVSEAASETITLRP